MRKQLFAVLALFALLLVPSFALAQQNTLTQTTLSAAITVSQNTFALASATNVTVGATSYNTDLYIDRELMVVTAVSGTVVTVLRGQGGTQAAAHSASNMVLVGRPSWFVAFDPQGTCVLANVVATPIVNYKTGAQWLCSSVSLTFVPGFGGSAGAVAANYSVTAPVASAAGQVTPSGPLFHITGALAITGFLIPVGCNATVRGGCTFTVIPDGTFTWTTANNIALAGTAVVNKALTFTWDATNSKWVPNYIA